MADMENVGLGHCTPAGWIFLSAMLFALWKTAQSLWLISSWGKLAAAVPAGLLLLISQAVFRDLIQQRSSPAAAAS